MQIVIDIPENIYKDIMTHNREMREGGKSAYYFEGLIQNGIPLPKSHGDLIDRKELIESPLCKTFGLRSIDIENAPTIIEADTEK